jgi:predicted RecA/RadA family phage recombinase
MATNFVQDGNTIEIENTGKDVIESGKPVAIGAIVAVALTDIDPGDIGDGCTSGVFLLPKLSADVVSIGEKVNIKGGKVQKAEGDAVAGVAWASAGAGITELAVKLNG